MPRQTKAQQRIRRAKVFRGLAEGRTLQEIAADLGLDPKTVSADVRAVDPAVSEWVEEHVKGSLGMAVATYQSIIATCWERIDADAEGAAPYLGIAKATTEALTKLTGAIAAQRVEHSGPGGGPIAVASLDLQGLDDEELEVMERVLSKLYDDSGPAEPGRDPGGA
jgi:hypothetical protein